MLPRSCAHFHLSSFSSSFACYLPSPPWILFECGQVSLLSLLLASRNLVWFISSLSLGFFGNVTFRVWPSLSFPSSSAVTLCPLSHLVYACSSCHQCIVYLMVCDCLCIRKSALSILFLVLVLRAVCRVKGSTTFSSNGTQSPCDSSLVLLSTFIFRAGV